MMMEIVIITHGMMAEGIQSSVEMIMGKQKNFHVLGLKENQDLTSFTSVVQEKTLGFEAGTEVLVFVDLFGATPFNTVAKLREELLQKKIKLRLVTGVNLPLVIEALSQRNAGKLKDIIDNVVMIGKESIESLSISDNED